jgi:DNA-directed RNA polymerase subunit RPC12/RpoP
MAKGYPVLPETQVLPECPACGSRRFRDEGDVLRCEDCNVRQVDPFGV